jgi:DNA (cytosine-5)-methyltransferase 1
LQSIYARITDKLFLAKIIIEFLEDHTEATYEDLLQKVQSVIPPYSLRPFTEEDLMLHAQYLCNEVDSYDNSAYYDQSLLMRTKCMKALVELSGYSTERLQKFMNLKGKQRHTKNKRRAAVIFFNLYLFL